MQHIFKQDLDNSKLTLLSPNGLECVVYKYGTSVVKLFKTSYPLEHLTLEEIEYLSKIPTKRILLPTGAVLSENNKVVGYHMPLVTGQKDIQKEKMSNIINEMHEIEQDLDLLDKFGVGLMDIGPANSVFNGNLYLIDPGNYLVCDNKPIKHQLDPQNLCEDDAILLRKWNEIKINKLFDVLLFSKNPDIDFSKCREIIQFFLKENHRINNNYNKEVFIKYFDPNLNVRESVNKFISQHSNEFSNEPNLYE